MKTSPNTDIGHDVVGYMLNTGLDTKNQQYVATLQENLLAQLPDVIWNAPSETLHITLMDWLAPLVGYDQGKDELFQELFPLYDSVALELFSDIGDIDISFNQLRVSPGAIFIAGEDNGQFQAIRSSFLDKVELLSGTKQPPNIIHFTVARFLREIDLSLVEEFVEQYSVEFNQKIDSFRLVRETKVPMLEYELIKKYQLERPID